MDQNESDRNLVGAIGTVILRMTAIARTGTAVRTVPTVTTGRVCVAYLHGLKVTPFSDNVSSR